MGLGHRLPTNHELSFVVTRLFLRGITRRLKVSVCRQLKILMWRPISCRDEQPSSNFVGKLSPAKNQPATTGSALLHVTKLLYTMWDSSGKLFVLLAAHEKIAEDLVSQEGITITRPLNSVPFLFTCKSMS